MFGIWYCQAIPPGPVEAFIAVTSTTDMSVFKGRLRFQGDSVVALLQHMYSSGLQFAPPEPGEKAFTGDFLTPCETSTSISARRKRTRLLPRVLIFLLSVATIHLRVQEDGHRNRDSLGCQASVRTRPGTRRVSGGTIPASPRSLTPSRYPARKGREALFRLGDDGWQLHPGGSGDLTVNQQTATGPVHSSLRRRCNRTHRFRPDFRFRFEASASNKCRPLRRPRRPPRKRRKPCRLLWLAAPLAARPVLADGGVQGDDFSPRAFDNAMGRMGAWGCGGRRPAVVLGGRFSRRLRRRSTSASTP